MAFYIYFGDVLAVLMIALLSLHLIVYGGGVKNHLFFI